MVTFKLAITQHNKVLAHYKSQLYQQQMLLNSIKWALPDNLKEHARYCVMANRKVLIYTESAAWASQLRFYNAAILDALLRRREASDVDVVQVRILNSTSTTQATVSRRPNLPTAKIIEQIGGARFNKKDVLDQALKKLSKAMANNIADSQRER